MNAHLRPNRLPRPPRREQGHRGPPPVVVEDPDSLPQGASKPISAGVLSNDALDVIERIEGEGGR